MTEGERLAVEIRALSLVNAIKAGRMNASAFEGIMQGLLNQPGFYPEHKADLMAWAVTIRDRGPA